MFAVIRLDSFVQLLWNNALQVSQGIGVVPALMGTGHPLQGVVVGVASTIWGIRLTWLPPSRMLVTFPCSVVAVSTDAAALLVEM